jgi:hypothetical protein
MAGLGVPDLASDFDFSDLVQLVRQTAAIDNFGETVLTGTTTSIRAAVQPAGPETLERLPEGARLSDYIEIWHTGRLYAESPGGYADVIIWNGQRWQIMQVLEDYTHFPGGFCRASCLLEAVSLGVTGAQ